MRVGSARGVSRVFVVFALGAVACTGGASNGGDGSSSSNGGASSSGGSSGNEPTARAQAIFEGTLEPGTDKECPDVGALFTLGDFGDPAGQPNVPAKPVKDGESWEQGTANVSCTVSSAGGDGFNVAASVALSGATGGLFRLDGKLTATGEQTGIHAIFSTRKSGNTYEQRDSQCIVRYTSPFHSVAAGRVWAEVTCPNAENAGAKTTCEARAQFRLENCGQ